MDPRGPPPTIYTAVYSGVAVFEMTINNVAVMRRRDDSWLNATQILKVAGVEKGKRTKVLEKEILSGTHEKVQGGYGKYQGTWIDFERGREFCRQYGVEHILAPLLNLDTTSTAGHDSTPTKEQAMAAKRKRMYNPSFSQPNGSNGLFPANSPAVTSALTTLGKASAMLESPSNRPGLSTVSSSVQGVMREDSHSQGNWPAPPASMMSDPSFLYNQQLPDSTYASQIVGHESQNDIHEPPSKRARASSPVQETADPIHEEGPAPPLNPHDIPNVESAKAILMDVFLRGEEQAIESLEQITPEQVDMPLDATGNTAIHWAAALARINVVRALINRGSNIFRVNESGETALTRSCFSTNNFDQNCFPALLNLLHPSIPIQDNHGRTVLHHIAVKSGMKGRGQDAKYYLNCLLEFVAKHGVASSATSNNQRGQTMRVISLERFISDVVNAQDKTGDTALAIAGRIGNHAIISPLLDVGADPSIPNRAGLRPCDFGVGVQNGQVVPAPNEQQQVRQLNYTVPQAVVQKREDIIKYLAMQDLIRSLENDFQKELDGKQSTVTTTLTSLRDVTSRLGAERSRANDLRTKVRKISDLRQACRNLKRALQEHPVTEGLPTPAEEGSGGAVIAGTAAGPNGTTTPATPAEGRRGSITEEQEPTTADTPYTLQNSLLAPVHSISNLTTTQLAYIKTLPPSTLLKSRLKGYKRNERSLQGTVQKLKEKSMDLENNFRRVVALSTGIEEQNVDGLIEGLVMAVESDPGEVDTNRVVGFLRKIGEAET
ncbi:hypothetical protein BZA77DRAFT_335793 [Pyronema omphalodes]|nr:hypothetical protein BZA77DRAFT_335793 [Pyronema omphalodes]